MDIGLNIEYDGDHYVTLSPLGVKEYPIGGMACEYRRLHPSTIKQILDSYPETNEPYTVEGYNRFVVWLLDEMKDKYDHITALMVQAEFVNIYLDLVTSGNLEKEEYLEKLSSEDYAPDVRDYVLENSGSDKFKNETIGDVLRVCYYIFGTAFIHFGLVFKAITEEFTKVEENEIATYIMSYFGDKAGNAQDIGYKLMFYDDNFHSVYVIKDSLSLLLFEFAHMLQTECTICKCENCGELFIPMGRSDAIYCNYPSPQDSTRKCSEIGAQIARKEKLKNDEAEHEYRKLYMRLKMQAKRHPNDKKYVHAIEELKKGGKVWRKQMADGEKTSEDFLEWVQNFTV